jgi:hypothetical protein
MMTAADTIAQEDSHNRPWIVEFHEFRCKDDRQREAIEGLDRGVLNEILRIWLQLRTPGAAFDPHGASPNLISFRARSEARRFVSSFGGRLIAKS